MTVEAGGETTPCAMMEDGTGEDDMADMVVGRPGDVNKRRTSSNEDWARKGA